MRLVVNQCHQLLEPNIIYSFVVSLTDESLSTFAKLKYELVPVRKEILKALNVVNVKDVVKRHLNDFQSSIIDLHLGSPSKSRSRETPQSNDNDDIDNDNEPDTDESVVELYNSSDEYNSCRSPLYTDEALDAQLSDAVNRCDIDDRVVTISRTEYMRLKESDKKCLEYEQKIQDLEQELRKVYMNTIAMTKLKKLADKEVSALKSELDHMADMVKYAEDKEDQRENRYFYGNKNPTTYHAKKTGKDVPKMIAIKNVETRADVGNEADQPKCETTLRTIYHDNRFVHKVDN